MKYVRNNKLGSALLLLNLIPLCLTVGATAIVVEAANLLRHASVPDDALLPSVCTYIHPAALVYLTLAYVMSIAIPIAALLLVRSECPGTNFQEENYRGADCNGANFQVASCQVSECQGSDCRGGNYQGSDCQRANFQGSNVRGAEQCGQDCNGSDKQSSKQR